MRVASAFEFKDLPEVYQIEVTSACNLKCPRCPRRDAVKARGGTSNLDVDMLKAWIDRGDLDGSWFVELQLAGEPLLHKDIRLIIDVLHHKAGVWVGMATNGQLLEEKLDAAKRLDAITVSIDATTQEAYEKFRPGGSLAKAERGLELLLASELRPKHFNIFTIQGLDETQEQVEERVGILRDRWPGVSVTYSGDCLAAHRGDAKAGTADVCINPWVSVSVHADGSVVSCCYAWDRRAPNYLGNLRDHSLRDIWHGIEAVRMRNLMANNHKFSGGYCEDCYARSPFLIHLAGLAEFRRRSVGGL